MAKTNRMIIPVSFTDREDYEYVKNQPNSSYFIRNLVKNYRKIQENDKKYVDLKIEELKKYIDSMKITTTNNKKNDEIKGAINKMIEGWGKC